MAPISCQREADVKHKEKDTLLILLSFSLPLKRGRESEAGEKGNKTQEGRPEAGR